MIHIETLQLKRLKIKFNEISLGDSLKLLSISPEKNEYGNSCSLRAIAKEETGLDPIMWTIEERAFAMAHYLISVEREINGVIPDFGGKGFESFLLEEDEPKKQTFITESEEFGEDKWEYSSLYGWQAEAIERTKGLVDIPNYAHFLLGCMAAQLTESEDKNIPEHSDVSGYDEYLMKKIRKFAAMPASYFESIFVQYEIAKEMSKAFFNWEVQEDGIYIATKRGQVDDKIYLTRFQFVDAIPPIAQRIKNLYS